MKAGDRCWVYHYLVQEIEEGVVAENDGNYIKVRTASRERPYVFVNNGCEVFPTREALCEHFRKIFE